MPYRNEDAHPAAAAGPVVVDQLAPRYGIAARDIFSEPRWTQVDAVRARAWHDVCSGTASQCSETAFD